MDRLDHLTLKELHEQLGKTEGNIATQRVLAAIGRKQGDTLAELAQRHDVAEKTIRNWLDRFSQLPLHEAPYDADRPGRPTKLTNTQQEMLMNDLQQSPEQFGYDRTTWSPVLLQEHLFERYHVEYSRRHIYRLLRAQK